MPVSLCVYVRTHACRCSHRLQEGIICPQRPELQHFVNCWLWGWELNLPVLCKSNKLSRKQGAISRTLSAKYLSLTKLQAKCSHLFPLLITDPTNSKSYAWYKYQLPQTTMIKKNKWDSQKKLASKLFSLLLREKSKLAQGW